MKILNIFLMLTFTQLTFASYEETQKRELKDTHIPTLYNATSEIKKGEYKLIRTHNSPIKPTITIIKHTGQIKTLRTNPSLAESRTGGLTLLGSRKIGTFPVKKRLEIALDFSEAAELGKDEIEEITLLLSFADDEIEVQDVSISTDNTDRNYQVKEDITGWFGHNKHDANISFVIEE